MITCLMCKDTYINMTYKHTYIHTYAGECMALRHALYIIHTYIPVHTYIHTYMQVNVRFTGTPCAETHQCIHAYIHTYIHTYIQVNVQF